MKSVTQPGITFQHDLRSGALRLFVWLALLLAPLQLEADSTVYDARINGREILTPSVSAQPRLTGPSLFGVRPGKPVRHCLSATGQRPLQFAAEGLPPGISLDPTSGWITGRAPLEASEIHLIVSAKNQHGSAQRKFTLRIGDTICLTPPMGWNSWYVHSEGVSEVAIRNMADAMQSQGLTQHGWTYLNIDDCWSGERDPITKALQPNAKFGNMRLLADYVNKRGLKLGLYSTPWISTYAGYVGGSAPNDQADYSAYTLPPNERRNPHQVFGRYPNAIDRGLATIGPAWFVDRDAKQFAEWGIDYVKYDWKEWTLEERAGKFQIREDLPQRKQSETGITQRLYRDFRAVDRDIVLSLSPNHDRHEDAFVPNYCNLWRLTTDIKAEWAHLVRPFRMADRLQRTQPGCYGDLDMLQIGPLGKPNRAEKVFRPSPLTPAEQYFQVTLWCLLTQPLLLSCDISTVDAFDLGLVTNDEVLAINQDPLCKQAKRIANKRRQWEIWAKDLADGSQAVALFNLTNHDQTIRLTADQLTATGQVRDLWRQRNLGAMGEQFSAQVSPHGVVLLKCDRPRPAE